LSKRKTIAIHPDAPAKPGVGAACNGCGVCCLAEPCPVGMVLSRRRAGACTALRWMQAEGRYGCGALLATRGHESNAPAWRRGLGRLMSGVVSRWIAADTGCDCTLEVERNDPSEGSSDVSSLKHSG
jgi:hypothetical protein